MVLGKLGICLQKDWGWTHISPCMGLKSRWMKDLNITTETFDPPEDKIGKIPEVLNVGKDFLNKTAISQGITARINKLDHIKLKSF